MGPTHPLFVVAGDDAILPCYIKPDTNAVDMRVEWFRLDQQESVVYLYESRENRTTEQSQSYRGRTTLIQQELQRGNASLRLSTVQVTDNGTYKCFIQSESWYDDITVDVIVEGKQSKHEHQIVTFECSRYISCITLIMLHYLFLV